MEVALCEYLWGGGVDCGWNYFLANGNSGGMLSIWDVNKGNLVFSFFGSGFSGVCLEWATMKERCFVVNIYSSCTMEGKRKLWDELRMTKKGFGKGLWCCVGDFNAVSTSSERKGVSRQQATQEIDEFKCFVADMELIDPPLLGRKYACYKADGSAMSRLDRFLLSEDWITIWRVSSQWALNRDVSDHCPIVLKRGSFNWGPKPFWFNNCWLNHPDFGNLVVEHWSKQVGSGWKAIALKDKLKTLRSVIRSWNVECFGMIDHKIKELEISISELDEQAEQRSLSEEEVLLRRDAFANLW